MCSNMIKYKYKSTAKFTKKYINKIVDLKFNNIIVKTNITLYFLVQHSDI